MNVGDATMWRMAVGDSMTRSLRTWLARLLGIALAFAASFSLGYLEVRNDQARLQELEKYGVEAKAVVARVEPQNHNTVYYQYFVNGREFFDSGGSRSPNPDGTALTVGDEIAIIYNSRSPDQSCACRAQDILDDNRLGIWLVGLSGGVGIMMFGAAFMRAIRPQRANAEIPQHPKATS